MSPHFEDIRANICFTINSFSSQYARKDFCTTPGFWLQHIHSTTCRHGTKNIQPSQLSSNTSDVWRRCPIDIITSHCVFVLVFTFEKLLLLNIQPYFFEIQHNFGRLFFVWPYHEICFKKLTNLWEWGRPAPSSVIFVKQRRDYRPAYNFVLCVCTVHDKSCGCSLPYLP